MHNLVCDFLLSGATVAAAAGIEAGTEMTAGIGIGTVHGMVEEDGVGAGVGGW